MESIRASGFQGGQVSEGSRFHCGDSTLIERHRLDQGEHAIAKAKRKLVNGPARRQREEMALPVEVDGDPGERTVIAGLHDGFAIALVIADP